jgi:dephospho-CoA kinase
MKIIGITGGTGSGKTSVLRMMERLGCYAIDADEVYHRLLVSSKPMLAEIRGAFPSAFKDDLLNTGVLAHIVYGDECEMTRLTRITTPYVIDKINVMLETGKKHNTPVAVIDAILIFESGLDRICDLVVGVVAPSEVRKARVMKRDGISEKNALMRMEAQPDEAFYREHCDYIIENSENDGQILDKTVAFYDLLVTDQIKTIRRRDACVEEKQA